MSWDKRPLIGGLYTFPASGQGLSTYTSSRSDHRAPEAVLV